MADTMDSAAPRAVRTHRDLSVYQKGFALAARIFELTKCFPKEETYSLTDQIRRSSRSACANIAEGWRKRRYEAAFVAKLADADGEVAETQTWLEFAVRCGYLPADTGRALHRQYDEIAGGLVAMMAHPEKWVLPVPYRRSQNDVQ